MEEDHLTGPPRCGTNGTASLPFDRAAVEGLGAETADMDRRKHRLARAIGWVPYDFPVSPLLESLAYLDDVVDRECAHFWRRVAEKLDEDIMRPPPPRLGME